MKNALSIKLAALATVLSLPFTMSFPQARHANNEESARRFVENLYAGYGPSSDPPNLFEKNAKDTFDHSLIALANTEEAAAAGLGGVGVLDYDPVCSCQDTDVNFPNLKILIQPVDATHATAAVTFSGDNYEPNTIILTLVREQGHWLIFNIENLSGLGPHTDLRTMLKAAIQKFSSKQK